MSSKFTTCSAFTSALFACTLSGILVSSMKVPGIGLVIWLSCLFLCCYCDNRNGNSEKNLN